MLNIRVSQDSDTKALLNRMVVALERIELWLRPVLAKPGKVFVSSKEQIGMSMFAFTFALPTPANSDDVAARVIAVSVNGASPAKTAVDKTASVSPEFIFNDGDSVTVKVIDADAAGNKAEGEALSFAVVDDVPPATPGALSVASKRQI